MSARNEWVRALDGDGATLSPPLTHIRKNGGLVVLSSKDGKARMTFTGGTLDMHGFTLTPVAPVQADAGPSTAETGTGGPSNPEGGAVRE